MKFPIVSSGRYFEGIVEAVVGGENLQVGIEHHQWLVHGFYNVLGIFPGILDFRFQLLANRAIND